MSTVTDFRAETLLDKELRRALFCLRSSVSMGSPSAIARLHPGAIANASLEGGRIGETYCSRS
jgi:hypothetical protein